LKNGSFQTQGQSSPSIELANYSEMHKSELQKALYWLMSSGRQACFLVTRTSSDHSISLCPQTTQLAHGNHPALLKNSDQPSFCSANFSPSISAEALQASDVSPVPA